MIAIYCRILHVSRQKARKSEDLSKRNFAAAKPLEKGVTDITEIPAKDGKLYASAIFDCFDAASLGISMAGAERKRCKHFQCSFQPFPYKNHRKSHIGLVLFCFDLFSAYISYVTVMFLIIR